MSSGTATIPVEIRRSLATFRPNPVNERHVHCSSTSGTTGFRASAILVGRCTRMHILNERLSATTCNGGSSLPPRGHTPHGADSRGQWVMPRAILSRPMTSAGGEATEVPVPGAGRREGGHPGESSGESPEGEQGGQDDPENGKDCAWDRRMPGKGGESS